MKKLKQLLADIGGSRVAESRSEKDQFKPEEEKPSQTPGTNSRMNGIFEILTIESSPARDAEWIWC